MMLCFDRIREAIEERDLESAEEIIDQMDCYDQIKGVARKIFKQMRDPECYTFALYRRVLEKCYRVSRDWDIYNLLKRIGDLENSFEDLEEYVEEEAEEQ